MSPHAALVPPERAQRRCSLVWRVLGCAWLV